MRAGDWARSGLCSLAEAERKGLWLSYVGVVREAGGKNEKRRRGRLCVVV